MFRVLIKLAIAALVIHAVFRAGTVYWRYYQFEDALQELAQFGEHRSDKQLCDQALNQASNLDVPVGAEGITIRRGANPAFNCGTGFDTTAPATSGPAARIFIDAHYTDQIQLLPGYNYPWEFRPGVNAWVRP